MDKYERAPLSRPGPVLWCRVRGCDPGPNVFMHQDVPIVNKAVRLQPQPHLRHTTQTTTQKPPLHPGFCGAVQCYLSIMRIKWPGVLSFSEKTNELSAVAFFLIVNFIPLFNYQNIRANILRKKKPNTFVIIFHDKLNFSHLITATRALKLRYNESHCKG